MTGFIKSIERAFPWLLLAPVILPVVIWGALIYPYLVPKVLLFYAISLITMAAFSLMVAYNRPFYWARLVRWETWIPAALLVLAYVASFFGIDFYRSFWSLFVRGDGLLMLTCMMASFYFIVLSASPAFFRRLLYAVAGVGSAVAVYGIGEWLLGGGRIESLLGNAAFFAGYLDIAFFATLAAAHTLQRGWRRAALIGAVLQVIAIILTATRGTILALAVAGVITLAYLAWRGEGKQRTWSASALLVFVVFGGLFFLFRSELANSPFQPIARVASISTADTDVASRLFIWKHMVPEIAQHPWLGVGAEHIDVLFNQFYDPTQIVEEWFDRSHNAFLDYAVQYGIGGLFLYLALIASFFTAAWRFARRDEPYLALVFSLLAVTYAVQNFFIFDTVSSFWLLLALLAGFCALSYGDVPRETLPTTPLVRLLAWPFAALIVLCIIPASVYPARAAYDLSEAYSYQLINVPLEVSYLSHGFALGTYGNLEYGYEAYDMYVNNQATALSGAPLTDAYQASLSILTANFNRYTYDARTAVFLAQELSLAPPGTPVDTTLLSAALTRAIQESPKRSQPWYILVNLSISQANTYPGQSPQRVAGYAAAQDILTKYIATVPTLSEPHFVMAQLLYASGNTAGAAAEAVKGKEYYQSDLETAKRAATYYETVLDLPDAEFFLKEIVQLDPTNTAAAGDLAKIQTYEQSKN